MINLIRDIGAYSVILITSWLKPAFMFGMSFDFPISVNDMAFACLHPSMTIFLAIKKTELKSNFQLTYLQKLCMKFGLLTLVVSIRT